jgi:hypothetical protein
MDLDKTIIFSAIYGKGTWKVKSKLVAEYGDTVIYFSGLLLSQRHLDVLRGISILWIKQNKPETVKFVEKRIFDAIGGKANNLDIDSMYDILIEIYFGEVEFIEAKQSFKMLKFINYVYFDVKTQEFLVNINPEFMGLLTEYPARPAT